MSGPRLRPGRSGPAKWGLSVTWRPGEAEAAVPPDRARRIILEEARARAEAYANGGLDRVIGEIADPVARVAFLAALQDCRDNWLATVKLISRQDSRNRSTRRRLVRAAD